MSASKQRKPSRMEVRLKVPKENREPLGKKYKNKNDFWTDLQKHYNLAKSSSSRIFNEHVANISGVLINRDKLSLVSNPTEFNSLNDSILKEISIYNNKLEVIYSKHKDFKGSAIETDETVQAMALINDYMEYAEDFKDNIIPLAAKFNGMVKKINSAYTKQNTK